MHTMHTMQTMYTMYTMYTIYTMYIDHVICSKIWWTSTTWKKNLAKLVSGGKNRRLETMTWVWGLTTFGMF